MKIKDIINNEILRFFGGSAGILISMLLVGKNALGMTFWQSVLFCLGIYVAILIFRILYLYIKENTIKISKEEHEKSLNELNEKNKAFRQILFEQGEILSRSYENFLLNNDWNFEITKKFLANLCNELKKQMELLTGAKCSISIKYMVDNTPMTPDAKMSNLCRDYVSTYRDTEDYRNGNHRVFNNSPFNHIYTKYSKGKLNELYYLNNNVKNDENYQSSSIGTYTQDELHYESEIVYAISNCKDDIIGFLCIDSDKAESFNKDYFPSILNPFTKLTYNIIKSNQKSYGQSKQES